MSSKGFDSGVDEEGLELGEMREEVVEPGLELVVRFGPVLDPADVGLDYEGGESWEGREVQGIVERDEDLRRGEEDG